MDILACMRCASRDLVAPAEHEATAGDDLASWTCLRCGLTGPAVRFPDQEAYERFRAERAVLYKPDAEASAYDAMAPEAPRRGWLGAGLAALVGGFFVLSAALMVLTALRSGGAAWWVLAPSAVFAALMGLPFLALARRR